jgi:hypothetical protein
VGYSGARTVCIEGDWLIAMACIEMKTRCSHLYSAPVPHFGHWAPLNNSLCVAIKCSSSWIPFPPFISTGNYSNHAKTHCSNKQEAESTRKRFLKAKELKFSLFITFLSYFMPSLIFDILINQCFKFCLSYFQIIFIASFQLYIQRVHVNKVIFLLPAI